MTAAKKARHRAEKGATSNGAAKGRFFEIDLQGLATFLSRRHRYATAYRVACDLGIPEATVKNWLELRNAPNAHHVLAMLDPEHGYGPSVLVAMWPGMVPAWLDAGVRAAAAAELELRIREDKARLDALKGAV